MKNLIITALLMIGMTSFAQEAKTTEVRKQRTEKLTPEQRTEAHLKKMTVELGLNASQQVEIGKILAENNAKREAFKANRKANRESQQAVDAEKRAEMKQQLLAQRKATEERYQKILTKDQYLKLQQIQAERKAEKKEHKVLKAKKINRTQEIKK